MKGFAIDGGAFTERRFSEGKVKYEIDPHGMLVEEAGRRMPLLLEFDSTREAHGPTHTWAIESIEAEKMILWSKHIDRGEFIRTEGHKISDEPREVQRAETAGAPTDDT